MILIYVLFKNVKNLTAFLSTFKDKFKDSHFGSKHMASRDFGSRNFGMRKAFTENDTTTVNHSWCARKVSYVERSVALSMHLHGGKCFASNMGGQ